MSVGTATAIAIRALRMRSGRRLATRTDQPVVLITTGLFGTRIQAPVSAIPTEFRVPAPMISGNHMKNIDDAIANYRSAKIYLWNEHFRRIVRDIKECQPLDWYEEIDLRLLRALVCYPNGITLDDRFVQGITWIPEILIDPRHPKSVELSFADPIKSGNRHWEIAKKIDVRGSRLSFIELFDWNKYGEISCSLVRAGIEEFDSNPDYVGKEVLVRLDLVRAFRT